MSATLRPVAPAERLPQLDILRGFALLGVLLVNLDLFSGAEFARDAGVPYGMGWGGAALAFLRSALLESKSAALLAMLFGAGIAIQYDHAQTRGVPYLPHAFRRAGALALLGLAHTLLLWNFDILLDYAVISLLVLPFMRLKGGRILWAIPALLVITVLIALPVIAQGERPGLALETWTNAQRYYAHGTWLEALRYRAWEFVHVAGPQRLANRLPILSPFFILGIYFWRKGLFAEPQSHVSTLRRLFVWCFVLGLIANLIPQDRLHEAVTHLTFRPLRVLIKAVAFFARPALTIGYASGILLLFLAPAGQRALGVLAPLGRTTLSQYLLQSVVCTLIFNGYGLGLYGLVPMNVCILGGIAFFTLQLWASQLWLARFRTGPVEWLWRRMTYTTTRA